MAFEKTNKDFNGRSIVHRLAFDQLAKQMREVLEALASDEDKKAYVDGTDNYGNTPLLLSCIRRYYDNDAKQADQYQIVKDLLDLGRADPNWSNPKTAFAPLHWAAAHGADDIVKILLEFNAKPYITDKKGYFPIDYAGLFKHHSTV